MQPKGLLLILACLLTVAIKSRQQSCVQRLMIVIGGYATVGLVVILYFAYIGALDDVVYANIVWPLTHYGGVNAVPYGFGLRAILLGAVDSSVAAVLWFTSYGGLSPALSSWSRYLLVVCCPAILAASAISRPFSAFTHESLPYWTIGIAIWASELHRKDMAHLFWGSPVLIILIVHLLNRHATCCSCQLHPPGMRVFGYARDGLSSIWCVAGASSDCYTEGHWVHVKPRHSFVVAYSTCKARARCVCIPLLSHVLLSVWR